LDETGKQLNSRQWADKIGHWRDDGHSEMMCVLGAADGLNEALRARADFCLSLGQMTWPHMLARVLLSEQIYRGISILSGHPYHRD
jgi:23S rRNA (pseudouridine1915-N3)-methyltransferase